VGRRRLLIPARLGRPLARGQAGRDALAGLVGGATVRAPRPAWARRSSSPLGPGRDWGRRPCASGHSDDLSPVVDGMHQRPGAAEGPQIDRHPRMPYEPSRSGSRVPLNQHVARLFIAIATPRSEIPPSSQMTAWPSPDDFVREEASRFAGAGCDSVANLRRGAIPRNRVSCCHQTRGGVAEWLMRAILKAARSEIHDVWAEPRRRCANAH
jgi:hypothetical protein